VLEQRDKLVEERKAMIENKLKKVIQLVSLVGTYRPEPRCSITFSPLV
jgi:hypothetical protein